MALVQGYDDDKLFGAMSEVLGEPLVPQAPAAPAAVAAPPPPLEPGAVDRALADHFKSDAGRPQAEGWGMLDNLKTFGRAMAENTINMLPGMNPLVITDYEAAPAPRDYSLKFDPAVMAGGQGGMAPTPMQVQQQLQNSQQPMQPDSFDAGKVIDTGADLFSGLGTGILGATAAGPAGMGVAGGLDQLGRNYEEKRIEELRKLMSADPTLDKDTADQKARESGKVKLDAGDFGDAALAGLIQYGGGKLGEKLLDGAAKAAFYEGAGPIKQMLKAAVPQAAYDTVTGGIQGLSSMLNRENASPADLPKLLSNPDVLKAAGKDALISGAMSVGGQGLMGGNESKSIKGMKETGDSLRMMGAGTSPQTFEMLRPKPEPMLKLPPMPEFKMPTMPEFKMPPMPRMPDLSKYKPELPGLPVAAEKLKQGAKDAGNAFKVGVTDRFRKFMENRGEQGAPESPAPMESPRETPATQREVIAGPDGAVQRVLGKETVYAHPGRTVEQEPFNGRYELIDLDSLQPSNLPESGFQRNPNYPAIIQNRNYDRNILEQGKVERNARELSPSKIINENISSDDAPPIKDSEGNLLAGNSRTMSLRLARERFPERYQEYRNYLKQNADKFGFKPEDVDAIKSPVLVRSIDFPNDTDLSARKAFGSAANRSVSLRQSPAEMGSTLAASGRIPEEVVQNLMESVAGDRLGQALNDERFLWSFRDALDADSPEEAAAMFTPDGRLNEQGKAVAKSMLYHHAVGDRDLANYLSTEESGISGKVESAIMPIVESRNRTNPDWQIEDDLRQALRMVSENPKAKTAEDVIAGSTGDMVNNLDAEKTAAGLSEKAKALIHLLKSPRKTALREALREYEPIARDQDGMFADPDLDAGDTMMEIAQRVLRKADSEKNAAEASAVAESAPPVYGRELPDEGEADPYGATETMLDESPDVERVPVESGTKKIGERHPLKDGIYTHVDAAASSKAIVDLALRHKERDGVRGVAYNQVTPADVKAYQRVGVSITDNAWHEVTKDEIAHVLKQHGDAVKEANRGQLPITPKDFARLPEVVRPENIHAVVVRKDKSIGVIYQKRVNGHVILVESTGPTGRKFQLNTMEKKATKWSDRAVLSNASIDQVLYVRSETGSAPSPTELNTDPETELFDREDVVRRPRKPTDPVNSRTDYGLAKQYNRELQATPPAEPEAAAARTKRLGLLREQLEKRGVKITDDGVPEAELQRLLDTPIPKQKAEFGRPEEGFQAAEPESAKSELGSTYSSRRPIEAQPLEQPEVVQLFKDITGGVPKVALAKASKRGSVTIADKLENIKTFINALNAGDNELATRVLGHELFHIIDWIGGHANTIRRGNVVRRLMSDSKTILTALGDYRYKWQKIDPTLNLQTIKDEMWELSKAVRPFDEELATPSELEYRKRAEELYADFGSAVVMNPKLAQEMAPETFKGFFKYLDEKPAVREAYENMVNLVGGSRETLLENRSKRLEDMFARGKQHRTEVTEAVEKDLNGPGGPKRYIAKLIHDSSYDVNHFVEDTLGIERYSDPWAKYKNLKDKSQGWGNGDSLMFGELERNVDSVLREHDLSNTDIGKVLVAQHVIETRYRRDADTGEMKRIFNPGGMTVESAREELSHLRKTLGDERFRILTEAADNARNIIFDNAVKAAHDSGIISDDQYKYYHDNKGSYARFSVINYITERVGSDLKEQIGTLADIENPYGVTALQGASLIRWAQQNNFKRKLAEMALEGGYKQAETVVNTQAMGEGEKPLVKTSFVQPPPGKGKIVEYWENGQKKGVIMPSYVVDSIGNDNLRELQGFVGFMAKLNRIPRMNFTKYSPIFNFYTSWIRDIPETSRGLSAITGTKIRNRDIIAEVFRQMKGETPLPVFIKRLAMLQTGKINSDPFIHARGEMNETVRDAIERAVLLPVNESLMWSDGSYSPSQDASRRFAEDHDVIERKKSTYAEKTAAIVAGHKTARAMVELVNRLPQVGEAINTAQKLSAVKLLKERTKLTDDQVNQLVRDFAGNPNTKTKGLKTPELDQYWLYTNVIEKSLHRNWEALKKNPTQFGRAIFKTAIVSASAAVAARTGMMGETMKEWAAGISEFDMSNYICIPVPPFTSVDKHGRQQSHYIRVPLDDASRFFHGLAWKIGDSAATKAEGGDLEAGKLATGMIAFGEGLTPGASPWAKIVGAGSSYIAGINPYDSFRGDRVVDDDVWQVGGPRAWKEMAGWSLQQLGLTNYVKFNDGLPSVGGFERFYRVSGKGWDEKEYEATEAARTEQAQKRLNSKDVWAEYYESADPSVIDRAEKEWRVTKNQATSLRKKAEATPLERKMQGLSSAKKKEIVAQMAGR